MNVITLDLETEGLDFQKDKILLTGYTVNEEEFTQFEGGPDGKLLALVADPLNVLRGHNVRFDALFMANSGYEVRCQFEDTKVLAYLNWPEEDSHSLKYLVKKKLRGTPTELSDIQFKPLKRDSAYLNREDYYEFSDGKLVRKDLLRKYHRDDVINVNLLRRTLQVPEWFTEVEQPLTRMLFEMQLYGAPLDGRLLEQLVRDFSDRRDDYLERLGTYSGKKETFNPNSPIQVQQVLKDRGYKLEDICEKTKTGFSVDAAVLKQLSWKGDLFAQNLLLFRKYSKLLSTYIEPFIDGVNRDGRLHGSINQAGSEDQHGEGSKGTNTGRLASSDPNLQNIPSRTKEGREVRRAFISSGPDWHMFDSDLSQIEPRLVAHYSQAPKLLKAYAEGLDTHGMFANDIFGREVEKDSIERFVGKTSWLATVYGCSYKKLLLICEGYSDGPLTLDLTNYKSAFDYLDFKQRKKIVAECGPDYRRIHAEWMFFKDVQQRFEKTNPELFEWRQTHINRTRRIGYVVTIGGRRIAIEGLDSSNFGDRLRAERQAVNYLIQGSAADIMKMIMVRAQKEIVGTGKGRIFAVVHDELLGELRDPKDTALVQDIMENTVKLRNVQIKTEAKLINSWADKK